MLALEAVDRLASRGFVTSDELNGACEAEILGDESHTIGYEVEVLASARNDIQNTADVELEDMYEVCSDSLNYYGYTVGSDGLYELQSPAAMHAHTLAVATRGLARFGWLPEKGTKGLVTSHVSVGTNVEIESNAVSIHIELIKILRAVEAFGGTTPSRLNFPIKKYHENSTWQVSEYGWNHKGAFGVNLIPSAEVCCQVSEWKGDNSRIEFRTLGYYNPKQFGAMLNAVYYLTRGMLTDDERASKIYDEYYYWLSEYNHKHKLPQLDAEDNPEDPRVLETYFTPYVQHLADADLAPIRQKTTQTIRYLRDEFGMASIPFEDDHLVESSSSLLFTS